MEIDLGNGFYQDDNQPFINLECTNWYPYYSQTRGSLSRVALNRTHGIELVDSPSTGISRGIYKCQKKNWMFTVAGNSLFVKQTSATPSFALGTIAGTGNVVMSDNGQTLMILAPNQFGYFLDLDTLVLTQITDPVFTDFMNTNSGVIWVTEHNNRFIYNTEDEFFNGSLVTTNKGRDFDALDFEDADSQNDPIVRCEEANNELYVFNAETIEIYQEVGGAGFPYLRVQGATTDIGLKGKFAMSKHIDQFYLIGSGYNSLTSVYVTSGGKYQRIATPAIDQILQGYTDYELSIAEGWLYDKDGSVFVGFNLINETIVYDLTASALAGEAIWHLRKTNGTVWRVKDCISIYGEAYVTDIQDGRIGRLTRNVATEYGNPVERVVSTPPIFNEGKPFFMNSANLGATRGQGAPLTNPPTALSNPMIGMEVLSEQGNVVIPLNEINLGNVGTYGLQTEWRRLGRYAYSCSLRLTYSDLTPIDIQRLDIDVRA